MRIVIFSDTFSPDINGVATSCGNLYKTLTNHGDEVMVLTSNSIDGHKSDYSSSIIRLKGIRFKRLYGYVISLFGSPKAMKILKQFKPDICHIQTDGPLGQFGFKVAKRTDASVVYTYHTSIEDYTYYVTHGWFFDKTAKAIVRRYVKHKGKKVDGLIVPSEKVATYMESLGIKLKANVVPTGFDFTPFKERDESKISELRNKFGISKDDYVILYLGRIAKEKSIDVLIEGFGEYLSKYEAKNVKLVIAGGGPDLKRLQGIVKEKKLEDKIIFTDRVEPKDTPAYYHLGDAYAFASVTETQGLTYLEALAAGLPIILRYDESYKDVIQNDVNGFVYTDTHQLADQINKVINLSPKDRENIIENGYKSLEPYTLERFYSSVMEVYKKAIKNHGQKGR